MLSPSSLVYESYDTKICHHLLNSITHTHTYHYSIEQVILPLKDTQVRSFKFPSFGKSEIKPGVIPLKCVSDMKKDLFAVPIDQPT